MDDVAKEVKYSVYSYVESKEQYEILIHQKEGWIKLQENISKV